MNHQRTHHKEASPLVSGVEVDVGSIEPANAVVQRGKRQAETEKALHDQLAGDMALSPALAAAMVVDVFHAMKGPAIDQRGGVSITALAEKIERTAVAIQGGDLAEVEQLLLAQAYALNVIFTQYCLRSAGAATQDRATELLAVAMKAQANSRATLATLVDLKFPKTTVIAKQANLSQGHQQVNNGADAIRSPDDHSGGGVGPTTVLRGPSSRARTRKSTDRTISEHRR